MTDAAEFKRAAIVRARRSTDSAQERYLRARARRTFGPAVEEFLPHLRRDGSPGMRSGSSCSFHPRPPTGHTQGGEDSTS
jgi:hypothetical protein